MSSIQAKDVFTIIEGKEGKSRWVKIGSAYGNKDGSINVILDALPCDGKVQIREKRKTEVKTSE
ncbi:MAG TPA: hypothetical protein PKU96_06705 [bacterium]|jgi:hypothetical protein|nr:hypothetical protein [Myxococcales bacterium]OQA60793.1 MAG: hypothetical protein BWY40_00882 [bacterium ADurb.Bin270]HPW46038.1 hypothetical protein [bacterium]HQC50740.1 hypothetical protein [bacterium]HQG13324.1 hypothetical protein [bacterium]